MTENDIRRIVREEIAAEAALVAAEQNAEADFGIARLDAITAEVDRRVEIEGAERTHRILAEVKRRHESDPGFLRA